MRIPHHSKLRKVGINSELPNIGLAAIFICSFIALTIWSERGWTDRVSYSLTLGSVVYAGLRLVSDKGPKNRRVQLLLRSQSPYSLSIERAFTEYLSHETGITLGKTIPQIDHGDIQVQISILRALNPAKLDALVILPCEGSSEIWTELERLATKNIFIVVLEIEPPKERFVEQGQRKPIFVAPNFGSSGEKIGELISISLQEKKNSNALVLYSPNYPFSSRQGIEIPMKIGHRLFVDQIQNQVAFQPIASWDKNLGSEQALTWLKENTKIRGNLVVYCGSDDILLELSEKIQMNRLTQSLTSRIKLIGCDGSKSEKGNLLVQKSPFAIATLEKHPEKIGRKAAEVIIREYFGNISSAVEYLIEPDLAIFE